MVREDVTKEEDFDEYEDAVRFLGGYLANSKTTRYASIESRFTRRPHGSDEEIWTVSYSGVQEYEDNFN